MRTPTATLADALDVLACDIESGDGVANAAIAEAAERLRESVVVRLEPTCAWLSDGTKITIKREGNRAWLEREVTPMVYPAESESNG